MTHLAKISIVVFVSIVTLISCCQSPKRGVEEGGYKYSHSPIKGAWSCEYESYSESIYFLSDGRFRQIATYEEDGVEHLLYDHKGEFELSGDTLILDNNRLIKVSFKRGKLYMHYRSGVLTYFKNKPF